MRMPAASAIIVTRASPGPCPGSGPRPGVGGGGGVGG
jgi:hypothetical protein